MTPAKRVAAESLAIVVRSQDSGKHHGRTVSLRQLGQLAELAGAEVGSTFHDQDRSGTQPAVLAQPLELTLGDRGPLVRVTGCE